MAPGMDDCHMTFPLPLTSDVVGGAPQPGAVLSSSLSPPGVLLPRDGLFAARAARMRTLSVDHELGLWLQALAGLCDLQQTLLDHACPVWRPSPSLAGAALPLHADQAGWTAHLPSLHRALLAAAPGVLSAIGAPGQGAGTSPAPHVRETLRSGLQAAQTVSDQTLLEHAQDLLHLSQGLPLQRPRQIGDLWLAASLQLLWTQAARHLPETPARPADRAACPCCGSLPVGGLVLSGDGKAGSRYLECSLCATRWNTERARCALCDSEREVDYLGLEGLSPAVQAEACDACGGSLKTLFQDRDAQVDPLADDLASLRLDVAVNEAGYGRAAVNLFLLEAGAPAG